MKLLLTIFFIFTIQLFAQNYKIVTEYFPPYQIYKNNKLSGINVDIVNEIQRRAGTHFPIEVLSWNEAYKQTLKNKNYIIFPIGRTQLRDKYFYWAGPIAKQKYVFFQKTADKTEIRTLNDAKKAKGILVSKNSLAHRVLLRLNFTNLIVVKNASSDKNIKTLAHINKNVLWAEDHSRGIYEIKHLGLNKKIKAMMTNHPLAMTTLNIGFNKNIDPKLVKKWQLILNEMKKDGTYDRIINKYK